MKSGPHKIKIEFFEYNGSAGLTLDWVGPNFARTRVTGSNLWYSPNSSPELAESLAWVKDSDLDGLCNREEVLYGTSQTKADTDGDGLTDKEELTIYGTNALAADSDGDSVSDYDEVKNTFTDALTADISGTYQTFMNIPGSSATFTSGEWQTSGSTVIALKNKGTLNYAMSLNEAGIYRLEVEGTQNNSLTTQSNFEISLYIDDSYCGTKTLTAAYGTIKSIAYCLPMLAAGSHAVKLYWNNTSPESFLRVNELRVQTISGPDADNDGTQDWLENRIANMCGLTVPATSKTSPVCVEGGNSQNIEMISVSGYYTPENETPVAPAILRQSKNKWYTDVPISPTAVSNLSFSFQDGAKVVPASVTWTVTNAITENAITIRLNDSLRLTAYPEGNSAGTTSITVEGETYSVAATEGVVHKFENAGTFTVNASFTPDGGGDAVIGSMTVKVVSCAFNGTAACFLNVGRSWTNPGIPTEAVLENDYHLSLIESPLSPSGRTLDIAIREKRTAYVSARLSENGPVMAATSVTPLESQVSSRYFTTIEVFEDGSQLVEGKLIFNELPSDLRINLKIFVAGITFDDGTIERWVTAADFDEYGVYKYRFLRVKGAYSGNCHTVKYYQGDTYLNLYN